MISEEMIYMNALNRIFGFQSAAGRAVIEAAGSAAGVFRNENGILDGMNGSLAEYRARICSPALKEAERELEKVCDRGWRFVSYRDAGYPALLNECTDAPIGLYFRSRSAPEEIFPSIKEEKQDDDRKAGESGSACTGVDSGAFAVSIVGTRDISNYGREYSFKIVEALAGCREKPLIVSGLALGVDVAVQKAALECGLPTLSVMATGIDGIYPARHEYIGDRIASAKGCALISDYPLGTRPVAVNFIRRNRIIAGISNCTILVESKIKGGGMITCRLAYSYDRDLFALPGRLGDQRSEGCNFLIGKKMAEPVFSLSELPAMIGLSTLPQKKKERLQDILQRLYGDRDDFELFLQISKTIENERNVSAEEIAAKGGVALKKVSGICTIMESDGILSSDILGEYSINLKNI